MKKDHIYHLKLISGLEAVGRYVKSTKDKYTFKQLLLVEEIKDYNTGMSNLFLNKWDLGMEVDTVIGHSAVITTSEASLPIQRYYNASIEYNRVFIAENKDKEIERIAGVLEEKTKQQELLDSNNSSNVSDEELDNQVSETIILKQPNNESWLVLPTTKLVN